MSNSLMPGILYPSTLHPRVPVPPDNMAAPLLLPQGSQLNLGIITLRLPLPGRFGRPGIHHS